jgi:hypothetical protein
MERCAPRVQPRSHICTPRSAKKCEGMNPYLPKWTPTLGVRDPNFQRAILKAKTHWIKDFLIPLASSWDINV